MLTYIYQSNNFPCLSLIWIYWVHAAKRKRGSNMHYLMDVYSIFGASKYILSDRGGEFTSKQVSWLYTHRQFNKRTDTWFSKSTLEKTCLQP